VDLTDPTSLGTLLAGTAIVIGLFGIVLPMVPGLVLCWVGVLCWAVLADGGAVRWVVLGIATVITLTGLVVKWAWPGRNLKRSGVPNSSLLAGGLLGIIGFFVIPVIGLILGFVLGLWAAERLRLGDNRLAWPATRHALKAAGLAILVELAAGLTVAAAWLVGVALA
jgi:uncharacterized protein YqgC (DUF456 family)